MAKNNIIIIDPGKSTFKTLLFSDGIIKSNRFISKSKQTIRFPETRGDCGQFQTIYNNKKFLVGSIDAGFDTSATKNNSSTYIKIISAIGYWLSVLKDNKIEFDLIIGTPTSDYANEQKKEELINEIKSFKKNEFIVDGSKFIPNIQKVSLYPEGMGLATRIFNRPEYIGKKLLVIDFGAYNINLRLIDEKNNILLSKSLDNVGCNQIISNVKSELRKCIHADKLDLDETDITECITNNNFEKIRKYLTINKEEERELLDITITEFLEKGLFSISSEYSLNRSAEQTILLTGGGAYMLAPYFKQMFKENESALTLSLNPVWENAHSYLLKGLGTQLKNKSLLQGICVHFSNLDLDKK